MEELNCIEKNPKETPQYSVIWLHGLGASGHDFEDVAEQFAQQLPVPVRFVLPHAPSIPVTINGNMVMPAWYDIIDLGSPRKYDQSTVDNTVSQIHELIESEISNGVPAENVFLAGFSQGGAIAYHVGLRYKKKLAGIIALSTYLLLSENGIEGLSEENKQIAIFKGHGTGDPVIPMEMALKSKDLLEEQGYSIEWHEYPMPHSVCPEELTHLFQWLSQRLVSNG